MKMKYFFPPELIMSFDEGKSYLGEVLKSLFITEVDDYDLY